MVNGYGTKCKPFHTQIDNVHLWTFVLKTTACRWYNYCTKSEQSVNISLSDSQIVTYEIAAMTLNWAYKATVKSFQQEILTTYVQSIIC